MDAFLIVVIILQFAHIVYLEISSRAERERLSLKIMSKDITEYKVAMEGKVEEKKEEELDPYATIEEAGIKAVLEASEK